MKSDAVAQTGEPRRHTCSARRRLRRGAGRFASVFAFAGSLAALFALLGTRDLESYEHVFFSLDRGTAVEVVSVLGQPVYTLALGLGVRLPLQSSLGSSPAAPLAPYLPLPVTYWLLITLAMTAALLLVHRALEPLCTRAIAWLAATLLFCSVPMVVYTIHGDWPEAVVTYCAFVGCVFAPHALLAVLETETTTTARRLAAFSVLGSVWGLVGLSHPGWWPIVAAALVAASAVTLCRTDHPLRLRFAAVIALGAVSLLAVGLHVPDLLRDLNAAGYRAEMTRYVDATARNVITANLFPFAPALPEMPFGFTALAVVALVIGLTSANPHSRRLIVASALLSLTSSSATVLSPGSFALAPSNTWAFRDPAAALAVFSAACAAAVVRSSPGRHRYKGVAIAAFVFAALQGPAYAVTLTVMDFPRLADHRPWTHDFAAPEVRAARRGLNAIAPGKRLVLWPGVRDAMRSRRRSSTDLADAGFLVVSAWTKQRTMSNLIEPNEFLFNQSVEFSAEVLCDADAVQFLQLRYLLRPPDVPTCEPWTPIRGVRLDHWLEADIARNPDDRIRGLPARHLAEPYSRRPALSAGSAMLPLLVPLPGTSLTITSAHVVLTLEDLAVIEGHALVLPVAYDDAWRASSGEIHNAGGLLALVGVDQPQVTMTFVPDLVAVLRAVAMTVAQMLALLGLLGLAFVGRVAEPLPSPLPDAVHRLRFFLSRLAPLLRERRDWLFFACGIALLARLYSQPEDSPSIAPFVFLPLTALTIAHFAREPWHSWIGGTFFGFLLLRVAAGGSRAAAAGHDPLFWAVLAMAAFVVTAMTRRRPPVAVCAAATAGCCTAIATLLPSFPGFESHLPQLDTLLFRESFRALAHQLGFVSVLCLVSMWIQATMPSTTRFEQMGASDAAIRGALLATLLLVFSGIEVSVDAGWALGLGVLIGLSEAKSRALRGRPSSERGR